MPQVQYELWAGCPHPAGLTMRLPHIAPFSKSPLYFFTACTYERRAVLANRLAFTALNEVWQKSGHLDGWYVGRFLLMSDHVHFFAMPAAEAKPRGAWNKMWKSVTSRRMAKEFAVHPPFWQDDTFDHILRGPESYEEKWTYVRDNPVRAGLCKKADDWPWQGEIHVLKFGG